MKTLMLISLFIFISCSDDKFRKVEQLDGFRILAIEANNPEVAAGGSATLRLYVSDPKGPTGGRTLNGVTTACIDPGIAFGASVGCGHDPNRVTGTYTIDTSAADLLNNLFTGFSGSLSVTVPTTILLGRSSREQLNGVAYIVIFDFTVDGKQFSTFKRIIATTRGTLNINPTGSALLLNGATFAGNPQKDDRLRLTTSAPESYNYMNVDGSVETRMENQRVAWYVSDAEFDKPKASLSEEVKLIADPPVGPYLFVTIVRDDRGGVNVLRTKIP